MTQEKAEIHYYVKNTRDKNKLTVNLYITL